MWYVERRERRANGWKSDEKNFPQMFSTLRETCAESDFCEKQKNGSDVGTSLNLDFFTTASEEEFGEKDKPLGARRAWFEPTRNFLHSARSEIGEASGDSIEREAFNLPSEPIVELHVNIENLGDCVDYVKLCLFFLPVQR